MKACRRGKRRRGSGSAYRVQSGGSHGRRLASWHRDHKAIAALRDSVGTTLDLFAPAECANYFKAAGYDPD